MGFGSALAFVDRFSTQWFPRYQESTCCQSHRYIAIFLKPLLLLLISRLFWSLCFIVEKQGKLEEAFNRLMVDVKDNVMSKNRDRFTQNLALFINDVRTFIV